MKKVIKVDAQYPENLHDLHTDLPFLPEKSKLKKSKSWHLIYMKKLNMSYK